MAGDCTCRQCCERFSWAGASVPTEYGFIIDPLLAFDPFDYYGERNHRFDILTTFLSGSPSTNRPANDASANRFWYKPLTVDALLWCDANGQNELARLRLRSAIGPTHTITSGGVAGTDPLTTHTISLRDDWANGIGDSGGEIEFAEVLLFLELVVGGSTVQSHRIANVYDSPELPHFSLSATGPQGLAVQWLVGYRDGTIYAAARFGNGPGYFSAVDDSLWLAYPLHIFTPYSVSGIPQHNRMAVSRTAEPLAEVRAQHYARRDVRIKTPCVPEDVAPYCGNGELVDNKNAWPWRGPCVLWDRNENIIGARCGSTTTALELTIPEPDLPAGWLADDEQYIYARLLAGTYELTAEQGGQEIVPSSFWFSDAPGKSISRGATYELEPGWFVSWPGGAKTFTLQAIELSAVMEFDSVPRDTAPCNSGSWSPVVHFMLSFVVDERRYVYRFKAEANVDFLGGSAVEFKPYFVDMATCLNCFRPFSGINAFRVLGGALNVPYGYAMNRLDPFNLFFANPVLGPSISFGHQYSPTKSFAPPFSMRLV